MPMVPNNFSGLITFTRASGATFVGSNGLNQLAATNVPRFDYDPVTLAVKGLLIEEQRTNLLTYSEQFGNAAFWSINQNLTITANNIVAPDGTLTADKIVENTVNGSHGLYQTSPVFTAGISVTVSVYAKAGERFWLFITGVNDSNLGAWFNLQTGIVGTRQSLNTAASIISVGNGWYRCVITFSPTKNNPYLAFYMGTENGTISYTGDGVSGLYLWGAQAELGSFATSYIPTVASQVTRSADVASVNTLSPWYNATEGTLYVEVSTVAASARAATFSAGTITNQLWVQGGGTSERALQVYTSDAFVAQIGVLPSTLTKKIAGAYQTNNFAVSIDGGAAATDTSGAIGFFDRMNIGSRFDGAAAFTNGHIRRITYYPRKLSSAELQALTA